MVLEASTCSGGPTHLELDPSWSDPAPWSGPLQGRIEWYTGVGRYMGHGCWSGDASLLLPDGS